MPSGPERLSDDGETERRQDQTLLTGLESREDLERVLSKLETALENGSRPRTIVGRPLSFEFRTPRGTLA